MKIILSPFFISLFLFSCNSIKNVDAPAGMVFVPAKEDINEGFFMDISPVTVAEFDEFVKKTGYKTQAHVFGNAGVFDVKTGSWQMTDGANYLFPLGPNQNKIDNNQPVTQVSWNDALAYARWRGKRLPTYNEWTWAAKNAQADWSAQYAWGNDLEQNGSFKANVWQGSFPMVSEVKDGFQYTSPVGYFGKTPLGLTDVGGNIWQWCNDWATADTLSPQAEKLQYGGSFLCDMKICHGFKIGNTSHSTPETSLCHVGFRCVQDIKKP